MANFVVVVDHDSERRARFIEAIEPLLPPVEGLNIGRCAKGDFCAIWAASEKAPKSQVADDTGAAVIWGEAIGEPGPKRITARELRQLWNSPQGCVQGVFDGFYAAVLYDQRFGIIAGADLLGIFPIYYYGTDDVLLIGSSPELFRHHPAFRMEFNPRGLVGILLTIHIFEGDTLLRGVRRLGAGHALVCRLGECPKEVRQYKLPVSDKYFDLPFSAHVTMLDGVLNETITRHVHAGKRHSLLLSGGLDSRMLGGLLKRNGFDDITALTLGLPSDIEMKCAIPVAHTLGFKHHAVDISYDGYPEYANLVVRW
jgi:asparagine synthase (glutamine-hydrolysing)